jgi:hypothetical protein
VGGGPAGLSAAWYLAARGYRNVTVLERSERAGGKCRSITHDGRPVDLGAFTLTFAYGDVLRMARDVGIALVPQPKRLAADWDVRPVRVQSILAMLRRSYSMFAILLASVRYLLALWKYRSVLVPAGFAGMSRSGRFPELSLPFEEWAAARGMAPLVDLFRLAVTDMGYGHVRLMPAAYVLNYMNALNVLTIGLFVVGLGVGWPRRVAQGFGRLWEAVSWRLDVRLGAEITRVRRGGGTIAVEWTDRATGERQLAEFDRIIVSCQPSHLGSAVAWSAEEQALLEKVTTNDYWVTVYESAGLPNETIDVMHGVGNTRAGHPWEIMRPWPDSNAAVFYTFGEDAITAEQVDTLIREDVAVLFPGATLGRVIHQVCWPDYFPHVTGEELAGGYYDELEALQGKQGTWLAGALPAFESVAHVTEYSRQLVERYFPPV